MFEFFWLSVLGLGVIAYVLEEAGFPIAPIVLGIVLCKIVEQNLVQAMISTQGNLLGFFERPISAVLGTITLLLWLYTIGRLVFGRLRKTRTGASDTAV